MPGAELHAFDITFDSLSFRDPGIQYHERDWSEVDLEARERVHVLLLIELACRLPSLEDWIGESAGQLAYVRLKTR